MAKDAEARLTEHGAKVKFMEYLGGHGWYDNVYGRIRENLDWLQESNMP
jgi:predicted esterase